MTHATPSDGPGLVRAMGLAGLVATALCAMVGVGINIIPFMVQRSHPGVAGMVPLAFMVAAVPATLAALCYAVLSSAMPRAGGSYVYASRALSPTAGFLGSFAQWFGLSMGMGVVAYLFVPMVRDILATVGWTAAAGLLDRGLLRVPLALGAIWLFWGVNLVGIRTYERVVVGMAAAMVVGPAVMTAVGFLSTPELFVTTLEVRGWPLPPPAPLPDPSWRAFLGACVVLFSSFIGFDAIAQAGGEATQPARTLPRAIVVAMAGVTVYYIAFTAAVYHAVPWQHIYRVSLVQDTSAPALLAALMTPWLAVVILVAVTVAILNSIPSVMLANSRVLYAFGADGILPEALARVHPRHRTPHHAISVTAAAGSLSVIGCHVAGDFFLGVDVLVVSMIFNFMLMALAVVTMPRVNPGLHAQVAFLVSRRAQLAIAWTALVLLGALLLVQIVGDLRAATPWLRKSTTVWVLVMAGAAWLFSRSWRRLERQGRDPRRIVFARLPPGQP